jgi:hypothetical protein
MVLSVNVSLHDTISEVIELFHEFPFTAEVCRNDLGGGSNHIRFRLPLLPLFGIVPKNG